MATVSNYKADEYILAERDTVYTYVGVFQIWGQDNLPAIRNPKSTGYDYGITSGSAITGEGQVFPQAQYAIVNDMKIYVTEIDFGPTPVRSSSFTITDSNVSTANFILPFQAGIAATGRQLDENDMDKLDLITVVGSGQFTLYAEGLDGPLSGKYKIGYQIGVL